MIELNLTLNTNDAIEGVKGKYYPRVEYKESISLAKLAKHMHQHNTGGSDLPPSGTTGD